SDLSACSPIPIPSSASAETTPKSWRNSPPMTRSRWPCRTAKNIYTYPDVMVTTTPVIYAEGRRDTITNPQIIVEVLSRSTESYDRGQKFEYYRRVNSFQEYILIDQYRYYVEQFSKTEDGKWLLSEYEGDESILSLSSVEFQISLSDIYENVEFE
ncbi:MAG: Uma2 family endonuclease, partial [Okeania sp. SIO3B3]|nr:Uma2 family endonuclease [Okeania sp. SIO3B3]